MHTLLFALLPLVAKASAANASFADPSAVDASGASVLAGRDLAINNAAPPETCPKDYPGGCSCYRKGQLWCSLPETGNMADYDNDCEAKRHVLDIIYTLCTGPYHDRDKWFTFKNIRTKPGQNIYKCWPMKITPPRSSPYQ